MKIGVMGAMQEELTSLLREMEVINTVEQGKRTFYEGFLYNQEVVLVFSRWGKVSAATTVTQLICDFKVDRIVFTGIAGALAPHLNIGDIVVGHRFFQHDMDARPLMPQFEIPLTGLICFESAKDDIDTAICAVNQFFNEELSYVKSLEAYAIKSPKVYVGDIASGDLFVSSTQQKDAILAGLPSVLCVEMEGAAVAQVCYDFDLPLLVIRSISDTADHAAHIDFPIYLERVASEYAHYIIKAYFEAISKS